MNLTFRLLEYAISAFKLDINENAIERMTLHYYLHKNIETLFEKEIFSDYEIRIIGNKILTFCYAGNQYIFSSDENHVYLRNNRDEIIFRITLKDDGMDNYLCFQEEEKRIQKFQETNLTKEIYVYHKITTGEMQEVNSVTLGAFLEENNKALDKFRIMYMHPLECNKASWELFLDKIQRKNIFFAPKCSRMERLNIIFEQLEERCSKEYTRIKLK